MQCWNWKKCIYYMCFITYILATRINHSYTVLFLKCKKGADPVHPALLRLLFKLHVRIQPHACTQVLMHATKAQFNFRKVCWEIKGLSISVLKQRRWAKYCAALNNETRSCECYPWQSTLKGVLWHIWWHKALGGYQIKPDFTKCLCAQVELDKDMWIIQKRLL